ncbi:MAG: TolC family protein, partial [Sulfurimonadaceae bacterium]|nr:TolC family protein [Sulfurimonadaceae bacterium]
PTLDAGYNWRDVDKTTAFSYSPAYNYNLTAKYNLFSGFADKSLMVAQALTTEAQHLLLKAKKADVRLDVINAYTALLKAQKAVQTRHDALESLERSYNDTKVRYEQGIVAKNELLLIDVQRLGAEQALVAAKSDVLRSRNNLERVTGQSLQHDEMLYEITGSITPVDELEALTEQMYAKRSELQALYRLRKALDEQYDAATGSFYPRVDLSADYTVNDKALDFGGSTVQHKEVLTTTVNVSWNLYNGRANEAQRKQVLAQTSSHDADIDAMKLDLRYQLVDAYEAYRVAQSARDVAARAKESAEENFRITNDRYEYGDVDTLTLLQAQSDLTAARNAYNNAFYDLYVAASAIERITGE